MVILTPSWDREKQKVRGTRIRWWHWSTSEKLVVFSSIFQLRVLSMQRRGMGGMVTFQKSGIESRLIAYDRKLSINTPVRRGSWIYWELTRTPQLWSMWSRRGELRGDISSTSSEAGAGGVFLYMWDLQYLFFGASDAVFSQIEAKFDSTRGR